MSIRCDHRGIGMVWRGAVVLAVLMMGPLVANAAPILTGDSVQATLTANAGTVLTPFTSPAIVGSGSEFTGVFMDSGKVGAHWTVVVDISASSFSIGWTGGNTPIATSQFFNVSLTGLDFSPTAVITGVTQSGYTCTTADTMLCGFFNLGPTVSFTANSIDIPVSRLLSGLTYTYDITTGAPTNTAVPEPASLILLGTGLLSLTIGRSHRHRRTAVVNGSH